MEARKEASYGWVMVGIGALMTCVAAGAMFSLAVFMAAIAADTGWSRAEISGAMTVTILAMGFAGFAWGALSDRFGARPVVLAGAVLLGAGLLLSSRATSPWQFELGYGVLVGIATGSFFAPMMTVVTSWFEKHRSLAVSLVSVGVGVAPMTLSPFAAWLLGVVDWRTAQAILAALVWVTLVPAALFVRSAPPAANATGDAAAGGSDGGMTLSQALRSKEFAILAAVFFFCCGAHSGPIFHTVSYAMGCGLPAIAAVTIYSMEGVGGLVGRVAFGLAGDRFGAKRALVVGLLIQAIGAGAYTLASRLPEFYTVATIFGFAYGGVMPLYAVIAREYFGQRILGAVFGAAAMISSLGMSVGPWIGGWIFDTYRSYAALYIGSAIVGLLAVAAALMFPRAREPQPALA